MKSLYLIRGLPGSGKSTLANELSENGKYPVLSADMYFEDENGNYNWDVAQIKDAHRWCRSECGAIMATCNVLIGAGKDVNTTRGYFKKFTDGNKIFVANTFTQEWEMKDYFELAEIYGYRVFTIIVENRHGNVSIHNVPNETIQTMKTRFDIKL